MHLRVVTSPQYPDRGISNVSLRETALHKALFGEASQPWKQLDSVAFVNATCSDLPSTLIASRISLSNWSFEVLIVEVSPGRPVVGDADRTLSLFLPPNLPTTERFLEDVESIEFRMGGQFAKVTEEKFRKEVKGRVARGLTSVEKRLLPLFVFVREDGTEGGFPMDS